MEVTQNDLIYLIGLKEVEKSAMERVSASNIKRLEQLEEQPLKDKAYYDSELKIAVAKSTQDAGIISNLEVSNKALSDQNISLDQALTARKVHIEELELLVAECSTDCASLVDKVDSLTKSNEDLSQRVSVLSRNAKSRKTNLKTRKHE